MYIELTAGTLLCETYPNGQVRLTMAFTDKGKFRYFYKIIDFDSNLYEELQGLKIKQFEVANLTPISEGFYIAPLTTPVIVEFHEITGQQTDKLSISNESMGFALVGKACNHT